MKKTKTIFEYTTQEMADMIGINKSGLKQRVIKNRNINNSSWENVYYRRTGNIFLWSIKYFEEKKDICF